MMILAHQIRLVPTVAQEVYLRRACGTARFVWNWALAEWNRLYEAGEKPNGNELKKRFNVIKYEQFPWLHEIHRDAHSQPFANLQSAFVSFFKKKTKHPKFKKKGYHDTFYVANDRVDFDNQRINLPKVGWVKTREKLRFDGKIMNATVRRIANSWFVIVQVDVGEFHKPKTGNETIGVDLGIKTTATLSTGEKIDGPKALNKYQKRMVRLSRIHARRTKGSNNRAKSAMKLARLHHRISYIRQDFLHKLTTRLCRENQTVVIEDLHVKGMLRNHSLAKAISDEGWSELRRQLSYKAIVYGTEVVVADRWFPSSKRCSTCGTVKRELLLSEREFVCETCGVVLDRDVNAAMNLKQLGRVTPEVTPVEMEALARPRGRVKLPSLKQELYREHLCLQ